ncbi:hypothetical protein [Cysteiniphilum sp. JM-1]|uniref:hypothetical protein n=1 Tax=Cysteiniphilum sp. JM-1 TaxID=2610891 RepID=UPI0012443DDC|nr:hypothetical protein [Cysteiniphilum sp. JM-1]
MLRRFIKGCLFVLTLSLSITFAATKIVIDNVDTENQEVKVEIENTLCASLSWNGTIYFYDENNKLLGYKNFIKIGNIQNNLDANIPQKTKAKIVVKVGTQKLPRCSYSNFGHVRLAKFRLIVTDKKTRKVYSNTFAFIDTTGGKEEGFVNQLVDPDIMDDLINEKDKHFNGEELPESTDQNLLHKIFDTRKAITFGFCSLNNRDGATDCQQTKVTRVSKGDYAELYIRLLEKPQNISFFGLEQFIMRNDSGESVFITQEDIKNNGSDIIPWSTILNSGKICKGNYCCSYDPGFKNINCMSDGLEVKLPNPNSLQIFCLENGNITQSCMIASGNSKNRYKSNRWLW